MQSAATEQQTNNHLPEGQMVELIGIEPMT
jgi:hypothetical protein